MSMREGVTGWENMYSVSKGRGGEGEYVLYQ